MTKFTLKKSLLIAILAILPMTFFGQEEPQNYWTIGIEGGATSLFSDNDAFKLDKTSWNAGLFAGYTFSNSIYIYGNIGYVALEGELENGFNIDECNLFQANLNIGYDVLQLFRLNPHRFIGIVPHVGFGMMEHKTKTTFNDGTIVKVGYDEEGGSKGSGIGGRRHVYQNPFGVNFLFNISKHFQANVDFVALKTDTEMLDCHYDGKHSDWYGYANIGIAYKFGQKNSRKPCPECPPCEPDQDAIDKAIADAIEQYKADNPCPEPEALMEAETEEADTTESLNAIVYEEKDIHLTFKVGKTEVEDTQANNDEVTKISDDIDNGREIDVIRTVGYASPEGNTQQNEQLAENRAKSTANFIREKLGDNAEGIEFESEGMGADWDGFYAALENSNISNKAEIADTIKNSENPTATLNQMKAKYPALNELLNSLRRTQVFIK